MSPRHRDIEDDHIGPGAGGEIDQRAAIAGPPDRFRTVIALWRQVRIVNEPSNAAHSTKPVADAKAAGVRAARLFRLLRSAIIQRLARYWKISAERFVR